MSKTSLPLHHEKNARTASWPGTPGRAPSSNVEAGPAPISLAQRRQGMWQPDQSQAWEDRSESGRLEVATRQDIERLEAKIESLIARRQPPVPEWVSIPDYAAMKGVCTRTVNRWIEKGQLKVRGAGRNREVRAV